MPTLPTQEALHREQMLEQKLSTLQRLLSRTQEASKGSWQVTFIQILLMLLILLFWGSSERIGHFNCSNITVHIFYSVLFYHPQYVLRNRIHLYTFCACLLANLKGLLVQVDSWPGIKWGEICGLIQPNQSSDLISLRLLHWTVWLAVLINENVFMLWPCCAEKDGPSALSPRRWSVKTGCCLGWRWWAASCRCTPRCVPASLPRNIKLEHWSRLKSRRVVAMLGYHYPFFQYWC